MLVHLKRDQCEEELGTHSVARGGARRCEFAYQVGSSPPMPTTLFLRATQFAGNGMPSPHDRGKCEAVCTRDLREPLLGGAGVSICPHDSCVVSKATLPKRERGVARSRAIAPGQPHALASAANR